MGSASGKSDPRYNEQNARIEKHRNRGSSIGGVYERRRMNRKWSHSVMKVECVGETGGIGETSLDVHAALVWVMDMACLALQMYPTLVSLSYRRNLVGGVILLVSPYMVVVSHYRGGVDAEVSETLLHSETLRGGRGMSFPCDMLANDGVSFSGDQVLAKKQSTTIHPSTSKEQEGLGARETHHIARDTHISVLYNYLR
ncbi:hypothetical protein VTK73DRAFT_1591 [Phialemonium thermophilum]|uniref:Uncharacterized protein n=1 Tax=Phialemonium thermophilum TaxID=223376 RepID=A0ABR3Y4N2_9PEZI